MAHELVNTSVLSQGRAAVYEEPIGPAGVRIRERPRSRPAPGSVAVAIRAASINHLDLWLAHGAQRVTPPRVIAADGAGVVQESGDPSWKPGDEVVVFPTLCDWECESCRAGENVRCPHFGVLGEHSDGAACELIHLDARSVFRKPAALSWEEAAAFPLTFLTAWRMLMTRAQLKADETVLVIGAGAGVAVAAIQIARHIGARVLVTSRSEAKRKRALELGAEAAFESSSFSKAVRAATGDGVEVVFEHVGPATLDESMRSLAMGGRVVTCGSTSGVKAEVTMPRLFFRQASLLGSTMGNASEFEAVLQAMDRGLRPVVDSVYPLDEVQAALTRLDAAEQFGKVVLSVSAG
ncbi:MAG: zinc-binding dehydrogenase [Chloroflexi bacterium]|nr:MAG: zinc-binding dehydrogenase [Chloroflexota bacterium]TME56681.1 MAG: zinc-binding dehydrogenase [Chloroflexota bacterium]